MFTVETIQETVKNFKTLTNENESQRTYFESLRANWQDEIGENEIEHVASFFLGSSNNSGIKNLQ